MKTKVIYVPEHLSNISSTHQGGACASISLESNRRLQLLNKFHLSDLSCETTKNKCCKELPDLTSRKAEPYLLRIVGAPW